MKYHYFFNTVRRVIVQFLDMFNDINIARYNDDGQIFKYIKVPLRFMPKEKMFMWIQDRRNDKYLPIMSSQLNGIELATDRITNKGEKLRLNIDEEYKRILNPTPYNLQFQLNIMSKYMVDQDQILEQILPFFTPNAFIMIDIPELNVELENKVIFQSCSMDKSFEIGTEAYRTIIYTLDFTVQTYLFNPIISITKYYLTYNGNEYVLHDGSPQYIDDFKIEIKDFKVYINDVRVFDIYLEDYMGSYPPSGNMTSDVPSGENEMGINNYQREKINKEEIVKFFDYLHKYKVVYEDKELVFYGKSDNLEGIIKKLITKYYGNKDVMMEHKGTEPSLPIDRGHSMFTTILHGDDKSDPLFNMYMYEKMDDNVMREWKEAKERDDGD